MRIGVFGGTGMIGSRIVGEALARGHQPTVIVRDPRRHLAVEVPLVVADATDAAAVAGAVRDVDAVVSAIGGAASGRPGIVVDATHALIEGLRQARVKRLLVVGGAGGLRSASGARVIDDPGFPEAWKPASQAQIDALEIYRRQGSALDWSYLSPADVIEPGPRTGRYGTSADDLVVDGDGNSFISCEDYAVAVIDELENPTSIAGRLAVGPP
jgi:uncharacterized protein